MLSTLKTQQNQGVNWLQKEDKGKRTKELEEFKKAMEQAAYNSELTKEEKSKV